MKALSANYFLKAFLQTFPMAYYTCPGHKNFTFQLPGKCERRGTQEVGPNIKLKLWSGHMCQWVV